MHHVFASPVEFARLVNADLFEISLEPVPSSWLLRIRKVLLDSLDHLGKPAILKEGQSVLFSSRAFADHIGGKINRGGDDCAVDNRGCPTQH